MSLIYDDRDSAVQFSAGDWVQEGIAEEFRGTTSRTEKPGATARVTFTGRGISVYGTITILGLGNRPVSTYVVDGDSSNTVRFVGEQTDQIQRLAHFFTVSGLDYGQHILTVTNESSEGSLYLDYFEVFGFNDPGTSSSPSESPSSSPTPSQPAPTTEPRQPSNSSSLPLSSQSNVITTIPSRSSSGASKSSPTPLTSGSSASGLPAEPAQQSESDTGSGPPVGAIVGGIVGGIAIISCITFLVFVLFRRRRQRRRGHELPDDYLGTQMQPVASRTYATSHNTGNGGYAPSAHSTHLPLGSASSQSDAMIASAHPSHLASETPLGYPLSSASTIGGHMGGSSWYPTGTSEAQPQTTLTIGGYTVSNKVASNIATVTPERAAELDPPPGYQL